ncbi:MAG: nicotinate-nicotinamide nucleotide adenylyltransferase [Bacteriovorax sp.]
MSDQFQKCREIGNCFEFMPGSDGSHRQSELPRLFLKHEIKDSVTFFGGSFNPFHQGHRACMDLCPEKNILIVPDRNPFKANQEKENVYDDFVALAESLKETSYSLYPGFLGMRDLNPTSSWLPKVKISEKNFLMGDDSYMSLLHWKNPEILIKALTKLYVVPRQFSKADYMKIEKELLKMNPKLEVHYLDEHPYMNISSTKLRKS